MNRTVRITTLLAVLVLTPGVAMADAGVPMLFITLPAMILAIAPIILIEMFILKVTLGSSWRPAALVSSVANAASTFVGVPLAWAAFLVLEMVVGYPAGYFNINIGPVMGAIVYAAWLGPDEQNLYWMVPFSSMVLLVGYFYVSFWFEKAVAIRLLRDQPVGSIRLAVWRANLISYGLLELFAAGFLVYSVVAGKPGF
jgi:hypothetical protein